MKVKIKINYFYYLNGKFYFSPSYICLLIQKVKFSSSNIKIKRKLINYIFFMKRSSPDYKITYALISLKACNQQSRGGRQTPK